MREEDRITWIRFAYPIRRGAHRTAEHHAILLYAWRQYQWRRPSDFPIYPALQTVCKDRIDFPEWYTEAASEPEVRCSACEYLVRFWMRTNNGGEPDALPGL